MSSEPAPKERIGAFLSGKPIDRVPCVPLILNHAARVLGVKVRQYATDGLVMGRANVAAWRRYGHDLITIFTDTAILAEALGTKLKYPEDDAARVDVPAVSAPADADRVPRVDARRAGRLPVYLEAVRHCVRDVGSEVFVACCYPAPFTVAATLRGTGQFARDLYKNPALAEALLEKCTVLVEDFADAVAEAGGIPALVDPVASGSVISRAAFERFALPGIRRGLARIKALGLPPILHICGRTSSIIDLMADSGAAVLSLDQIELAEAREKVGGRVCLMGNVRPAETLLNGTPDDVRREAAKCVADALGSPGGFILSSGCEVPLATQPENVLAMMEVARQSRLN
ncbi:MAG: uroporphyrinogen decarboxylase [Planctomycetes bacterium]|nr:uroporphyrinogen decarboxylase [Planctomycetota bacterium]